MSWIIRMLRLLQPGRFTRGGIVRLAHVWQQMERHPRRGYGALVQLSRLESCTMQRSTAATHRQRALLPENLVFLEKCIARMLLVLSIH